MAALQAPGLPSSVDAILRDNKERLLEQWERAVIDDQAIPKARRFDRPMLRDSVPALLDYLAAAFARRARGEDPIDVSGLHAIAHEAARNRASQEYSVEESMREKAHLREVVIDLFYEEHVPLDHAEARIVNAVFDEVTRIEVVEVHRIACAQREIDGQRLRAILRFLPVGVVIVDANGAVIDESAEAAAIWGRSLLSIRGMDDYAGFKGFDPRTGVPLPLASWGIVRAVTHGEASWDQEMDIESADGTRKTILTSSVPIHDSGGKVAGAVKTLIDVTRRVRDARFHKVIAEATRVLGESFEYETTLKAVARLAVPHLASFVIVDLLESDGHVRRLDAVSADPRLAQVLARAGQFPPIPTSNSPAARVLRTGRSSLVREVSDKWMRSVAVNAAHLELIRAAAPRAGMLVAMAARGKTFGVMQFYWVEPGQHYDEDDLGIAEDLAGRAAVAIDNARLYHRAEQAVRERDASIAELNAFVSTSPVGFALLDRDLHFLHVNDAFATLNSTSVGDHLGKKPGEICGDLRESVEPALARAVVTGEPFHDLAVAVHGPEPGQKRHFLVGCSPLYLGAGEIRTLGVVVTEITAQERAAEELRRVAELRERFIGILGHDLRNPLASITLASSMLLRRTDLPEVVKQQIGCIGGSASRITQMIRDVLDFTRGRLGGGIPCEPREADLHAIVRQVLGELQVVHQDRRIMFAPDGDGRGVWDADRLAQVVSNLAANALAYSPADTPVAIATRDEGASVVLEIHNLGPPIPPASLPTLFDPFRHVGASPTGHGRTGGLGLGLYIVQQIVESHVGSIEVASDAEHGTTFTVRLPRECSPSQSRPG